MTTREDELTPRKAADLPPPAAEADGDPTEHVAHAVHGDAEGTGPAAADGDPIEHPAEHEPELSEEIEDHDEPAPPHRSVVQIGRRLFITMAVLGALAIVALSAATAYLLLDRRGGTDPVVATVNGDAIHRSEYDKAVAAGNGGQVLDGLILERLVEAEAKKRGITVDAQQTAGLLADQKKNFASDQEYQAALAQAGISETDLLKRLRINELLRQMVADQTQVTDQEIAAGYDATKDRYPGQTLDQVKDQVRAGLERQKVQKVLPGFLDQLKSSAKIEMHLPGATS